MYKRFQTGSATLRRAFLIFACIVLVAAAALGQEQRIVAPIETSLTVVLRGSRSQRAAQSTDLGMLDPSRRISGITLVFKPSQSQTTELGRLLQEQQNPASLSYHNWLTPEQYADLFGLSTADLEKINAWLEAEGFRVDYVARSRGWVEFSGAASQVSSAFHTEFHRYQEHGDEHFANIDDPSIPVAIAPVILLIRGLDNFRVPAPRLTARPVPDFTSGGSHFLTPGDLATIYDINPLYQSGITGTGQKIAVAGQTDIQLSDIERFRSLYGLPSNNPQLILVPGSADPGVSQDDVVESSLDLEYAGGIAPGAAVLFVYSQDVWTSASYAIDQAIAPVMSFSYGYCEPQIASDPSAAAVYLQGLAQQANAVGMTWLAASGDSGAAACDIGGVKAASQGLAVNLPASVPEVTGVGGTEFDEGSGSYWSAVNNANGSSALSYIPEMAWNDTSEDIAAGGGLTSTGGGASIFFAKPSWQTGAGVPNDHARDVPDISFDASNEHDSYLIYAGGQSLLVGGTSASTPVFSGAVAMLNQYLVANGIQSQAGLGNINPALYRLAQTTTGVFHDITVGNNIVPCVTGSPNCTNGQMGFSAGPGYDQATGLGSADVYNLVTRWNSSSSITTSTTASAAPSSISANTSTVITATVTAASGTNSPAGTVSFSVGGTVLGTAGLSGSGGVATADLSISGSQLAAGSNMISAFYNGSATFAVSSGTAPVTVATGPPSAVSVTPSSGGGSSQTFAFTFTDPNGASDIVTAYMDVNASLVPNGACYLSYTHASNTISLASDAGTWQSGLSVGSSGTSSNSQCAINAGASSVSMSGNTLTLNLALSFASGFAGAKNIYMDVKDATLDSGWSQKGAWTVPGTPAPALGAVSVTPASGSGASQTFAFTFTDPNGASDIVAAYMDVNASLVPNSACYLSYTRASNLISLANNAGAWQTGLPVGAAGTSSNSQCSINAAASSVSMSGSTLTLNLALSFASGFAGVKNIYMDVHNATLDSGWSQKGTWTVPGTPAPTLASVSVTPSGGSGTSQTFAFTFTDPNGASDIVTAYMDVNASLVPNSACYLSYTRASKQIALASNAGAWQTGLTIGGTGTSSNSQCTINAGASSVSASGDTLTLNLALSFSPGFAGAKNIFMDVKSATLDSGWSQKGAWTVP
jgi:hypothetical protein